MMFPYRCKRLLLYSIITAAIIFLATVAFNRVSFSSVAAPHYITVGPGSTTTYNILPQRSTFSQMRPDFCPLSNVAIIIHAFGSPSQIAMLTTTMSSIEHFVSCIHSVIIFLSKQSQLPIDMALFPSKHNVSVVYVDETPLKDLYSTRKTLWKSDKTISASIRQQWSRMWVDNFTAPIKDGGPEYLLYMDTDSIFTYPLTCQNLFDENGRPYWFYWADSYNWGPPISSALGRLHGCFVSFYPFLFHIDGLKIAREMSLEHRKRKSEAEGKPEVVIFDDAYVDVALETGLYSEFNLIGNALSFSEKGKEISNLQPCPRLSDLDNNRYKGSLCRDWAFPAAHLPYPYAPVLDNLPEKFSNWDFFLHAREWNLGKFTDNSDRYLTSVTDMIHHGRCIAMWHQKADRHSSSSSVPEQEWFPDCDSPKYKTLHPRTWAYLNGKGGINRDEEAVSRKFLTVDYTRKKCSEPIKKR